jgi:hypothetical protein
MAVVLLGLVVLGGGVIAGLASAWARRPGRYAQGTHAARTAPQHDPLRRRLRQGYSSIEITVHLDVANEDIGAGQVDRLIVGGRADAPDPGREFDRLVLGPLADRVAGCGGRVYAGRDPAVPFRLMVNVDDEDETRQVRAYQVLEAGLARYPGVFTRLSGDEVVPGAVTVILTGDDVPRSVLAARADRTVFADGTFADLGPWGAPPALAPVLGEQWFWRFDWNGRGELPADQRECLHRLVAAAHAEGREVRFGGVPRRPWRVREAFWCELASAGVDLITTSRPRALARFLDGYGLRGYGETGRRPAVAVRPRTAARRPAVPADGLARRAASRFADPAVAVAASAPTRTRPIGAHVVTRSGGRARAGTR